MKKLINKLKKNKIMYVFLLFIVFMFPSAFYTKSEYQQRAILVSVAIDKKEDDFSVSGLLVIPSSMGEFNANVEIVSGEGKTVSSALHQITSDLGKKVSLAHCDTIFVNDEVLSSEDMSRILDYFIRGVNATKNSMIIGIEGEGREFLETIKQSNKVNNFLASDLVNSENNLIGLTNVSLKEFYKEYFTPGQVSVMSLLTLSDDSQGASSGDGGQQSQGGGMSNVGSSTSTQGQSSQNKNIKSENKLAVLKKGKKLTVLEEESCDTYNLLYDQAKTDYFLLENLNIEDDQTNVTEIALEVVDKNIHKLFTFENNTPKLNLDVEIVVKLVEIIHEGEVDDEEISSVKTHVNENVKDAIKDYFNKGIEELKKISKVNKVDLFRFEDRLNKYYHKEWSKYLASLSDKEDYFNNIEVELNLRIKSKF